MILKKLFGQGRTMLSYEVFTPRTDDKHDSVKYAAEQVADLFANGINAGYVYFMYKLDAAATIMSNLSYIIGKNEGEAL